MKVLERDIVGVCEWCKSGGEPCNLLVYGEYDVMVICEKCLESLREFLEKVGVKDSEVWT